MPPPLPTTTLDKLLSIFVLSSANQTSKLLCTQLHFYHSTIDLILILFPLLCLSDDKCDPSNSHGPIHSTIAYSTTKHAPQCPFSIDGALGQLGFELECTLFGTKFGLLMNDLLFINNLALYSHNRRLFFTIITNKLFAQTQFSSGRIDSEQYQSFFSLLNSQDLHNYCCFSKIK